MLSLSPTTRIFVAVKALDMRQGFNGLYAWVQTVLGEEPTSGHWFVFLNKRRNRLKILTYDGSGLWILNKRLVSHCPLYRICKAALSVSPIVSSGRRFSGNYWRAIRHARNATARWHAAWDSGLDVRCGGLRGRAPFTSPDRAG
jgi:transposase